jgi:hypothetical protein
MWIPGARLLIVTSRKLNDQVKPFVAVDAACPRNTGHCTVKIFVGDQ